MVQRTHGHPFCRRLHARAGGERLHEQQGEAECGQLSHQGKEQMRLNVCSDGLCHACYGQLPARVACGVWDGMAYVAHVRVRHEEQVMMSLQVLRAVIPMQTMSSWGGTKDPCKLLSFAYSSTIDNVAGDCVASQSEPLETPFLALSLE